MGRGPGAGGQGQRSGFRKWRNEPNLWGRVEGEGRMAKRSQSGISDRVPAGMYHRLQCSARRVRISVKWLILFGEWVVNESRSMDH